MRFTKLGNTSSMFLSGGVSLIELLIGTVLATLVIAMCIQSFQTTRYTDSITRGSNEIQNQGRFGLAALQYGIEHAGFHSKLGIDAVTESFPAGNGFIEGQVIQVLEDAGGNSILRIRITGDSRIKMFDCRGSVIAETEVAVQRYSLNDESQLICAREDITVSESVLAQGVQAFQIILGRDTNNDQNIDQYIGPVDLVPTLQTNVLIAEIDILLNSETPVFNKERSESFDLLNSVSVSVNDRFLYKQLKDVFIVKNANVN